MFVSLLENHPVQIATATLAGATLIVGNDKAWQGKTGSLALLLLNEFV
ncbi:MAG: hypothetical protein WAU00_14500 [Caldilinea sp.]